MKNSRRQFLRNTALVTLTAGALPGIARPAKQSSQQDECFITTLDYYGQGPFYTAGAPQMTDNKLAADSEPGTRLVLSGAVRTLDCSKYIQDAVIDAWHANDAGQYDNVGYNLRGITQSNAQGFYMFETILPGKYLNGSSYRPSHIHFKITPPGYPTLTTQLYFEGDSDIPGDAAASITSGTYDATHRIIPISMNSGKYEGTWDIIVDGDGITGINDVHINNGMIYSVSPNPFTERVDIYYGVFRPSMVGIKVFNLNGVEVASLEERQLAPQKYFATWAPDRSLPSGIYFITLRINDMQVHYLKVMKS